MPRYTGAESIDYVIEKFKKNKSLLSEVKKQLQNITSQIYLKSQSSVNFCHRFFLPLNLPPKLVQVYGVPMEKLKHDFKTLGWQKNRMYEDPYYQTLMVLYLTGVYLNDEALRKLVLFLILIKLYNGRVYTYFRVNCNDDIANYIIRTKLRNTSLFKDKTPLQFLAYYIDTLDKKYVPEIKRDPKKYTLQLFMQAWGRLNQVFNRVAQLYYESYRKGEKDASITTLSKDEQGHLNVNDALLESATELIIDKYRKARMIKHIELPQSEVKFLSDRLIVTDQAVKKIENYINNDLNSSQVTEQLQILLKALNIKNENDLHKIPIVRAIDKVMGKKGEAHALAFKKLVDESLGEIFGQAFLNAVSVTQRLKLRKLYGYILFYQLKAVISKTHKFERI